MRYSMTDFEYGASSNRAFDRSECDICANRGPCNYCGRPDMFPAKMENPFVPKEYIEGLVQSLDDEAK